MASVINSLLQIPTTEALNKTLNEMQPSLFNAFNLAFEGMTQKIRNLISDRAYESFENCGCCQKCTHNGLWVEGLGDWIRQEPEEGNLAFHSRSGSLVAGWDHQMGRLATVGFFGSYVHNKINWQQSQTYGATNGFEAGVYGWGCLADLQIDSSLLFGYNRIHSDRHVQSVGVAPGSSLDRSAHRSSGDFSWDAHLGVGYPLSCCQIEFTPYVLADYFENYQDHYSETGADSINLIVDKQTSNLARFEEGLRLFSSINYCHHLWIPSISLAAVQEVRTEGRTLSAAMQGAAGTFVVKGMMPKRTLFSPTVELLVFPECGGLSFTLGYNAEFGKRIVNQNGYVKVGYDY